MAHDVEVGKPPVPAGGPPGPGKPHQFGLTAAMALIVGSIIGVGIFNLPTSLAAYGPITLVSMALTTVGALALALLFAALSRRLPADGGPYAYARVAHVRIRSETGARLPVLIGAIAAAGAVFVTFVFTTLIHEPASIATLLVIVVLSIGLDYGWKHFHGTRPNSVQLAH